MSYRLRSVPAEVSSGALQRVGRFSNVPIPIPITWFESENEIARQLVHISRCFRRGIVRLRRQGREIVRRTLVKTLLPEEEPSDFHGETRCRCPNEDLPRSSHSRKPARVERRGREHGSDSGEIGIAPVKSRSTRSERVRKCQRCDWHFSRAYRSKMAAALDPNTGTENRRRLGDGLIRLGVLRGKVIVTDDAVHYIVVTCTMIVLTAALCIIPMRQRTSSIYTKSRLSS